jgi:hypothetical protein
MGDDVPSLEEVQEKVAKMLKGSVLIGHALHNDLKALLLDHPRKDTRDTAKWVCPVCEGVLVKRGACGCGMVRVCERPGR